MLPKILTTKEILIALKVSPRTLDRWLAASSFPEPFRIGRARRWHEHDVRAFLDARKNGLAK
ncbi:helix-turn-helix transcriptional regulator [Rhizobium lentis]|uniref:helix-turn-helix transcriptional regulator n=1 Tax=Rhizobium lentis TaxID=1138194 RepID=UPI0035C8AE31